MWILTCSRPESQTLTWSESQWQWLGEGLEPMTSQIACHALTNWATESFGNSVGEFEYLSLSCQRSSQSKYQADMFSGEGTVSTKCEVQAQLLNMLQTWQLDLNLVKSGRKRGVGGSPCYNQDTVFVNSCMCQPWQSWTLLHVGGRPLQSLHTQTHILIGCWGWRNFCS